MIQLVRTQDPQLLAARGAVKVAEAQRVRADTLSDPSVGWNREHLGGGIEGSESEGLTVCGSPY